VTTIEQELRDAISERTDHVHAEAPPEAVLTARVGAARRRRTQRRAAALSAAAALVVAVAAVALVERGDDRDGVVATQPSTEVPTTAEAEGDPGTEVPETATTTTEPPTTTTAPTTEPTTDTTVPPGPVAPAAGTYVWPASPSDFGTDPVETARRFAATVLGMVDVVATERAAGPDVDHALVDVSPNGGTAHPTVVRLDHISAGPDGSGRAWYVTSAETDQIEVTTPDTGTTVRSPITLAGTSLAFEAQVNVVVLPVGASGTTTPYGQTFVMGGGTERAPFSGTVAYSAPAGTPAMLILSEGDASGRSRILRATVIPIVLAG